MNFLLRIRQSYRRFFYEFDTQQRQLLWDERLAISVKKTLTDKEKNRLREIAELLGHHGKTLFSIETHSNLEKKLRNLLLRLGYRKW